MKGVKRGRDEGRIVITLECKVSPETMAVSPAWQNDATSVLRDLMMGYTRNEGLTLTQLRDFLEEAGVFVVSTTYQATK